MKALSGAVAVVAFFAVTAGAHAAITSACPYAKSGYADGCATAPVNAAFLQANFSAHARQSGQNWVSSHPQPWDVAGWDYAVGYSRVPAPAFYPLVRPDLATAGGVAAGTNLPFTTAANGCVYTAAGNPLIKGGPAIICRGQLPANGTGAYAGKTVISGIDFSTDAAGHCVQLYLDVNTAQTLYVVNNNFKKGTGCYLAKTSNTDALINVVAGAASLVLTANVFNGAAPYRQDQANTVYMGGRGTVDVEYNAFLNNAGRVVNGDGRAGWTMKYNYIDGIAISPTAPHGEIAGTFPNDAWATIAYQDSEFNTAIWGVGTHGVAGINAGIFLSGGGDAQTLQLGKLVGNTLVSNLEYAGRVSSGKVLLSIEIPFVQSLVVENNYVDPSGSYLCMQVEGDEIGITGYIDDGQGLLNTFDGVPGNVLHVTARAGKDYILPGSQLFQMVGTSLPGNPVVLGGAGYNCNGVMMTGSTTETSPALTVGGTYCLSGPPVTAVGLSRVQTMPQIQSVAIAGNVDMLDGSTVTQGADIPWNNGACAGHGRN